VSARPEERVDRGGSTHVFAELLADRGGDEVTLRERRQARTAEAPAAAEPIAEDSDALVCRRLRLW